MQEKSWEIDRIKKIARRFERGKRTVAERKRFDEIIENEGWKEIISNRKIDPKLRILYLLDVREKNELYRVRLHITGLATRLKLGSRNTVNKHLDLLKKEGCVERWKRRTGRFGNVPKLRVSGKEIIRYAEWLMKIKNQIPTFSKLVFIPKLCRRPRLYRRSVEWYETVEYLRLRGFSEEEAIRSSGIPFFSKSLTPDEMRSFLQYGKEIGENFHVRSLRYWTEELKELFRDKETTSLFNLIDEHGGMGNFLEEVKLRREKEELESEEYVMQLKRFLTM